MNDKAYTNNIFEALELIVKFLQDNNINYCLIGGLAVQIHGEPRFTRDIDICIFAEITTQENLIDMFLNSFKPLLDEPKVFAVSSQILPLLIKDITVDISLGLTGFEKKVIERAKEHKLTENLLINIATAEDLIIYKCLASRPKDIQDIDSIISRNKGKLDLVYIKAILSDFESALSTSSLLSLLDERIKLLS